jgi:hypothetical protein
MDTWVRVWLGGLLFALWAVPTWWWVLAAVGIGVSVVVFIAALPGAAGSYAGLLEAAFDVHWRAFYDARDWPLPPSPAQEPKFGRAVTTYLAGAGGRVDQAWVPAQ